ncbi:MAG: hypothetical protein Q9170_003992 [Blastenia crenularia]
MPHATESTDAQDVQDEILIRQVLDPQGSFELPLELELGEKADDAVDYGDLSDDDLADDEVVSKMSLPDAEQQALVHGSLEDFTNKDGNEVAGMDDPFGEGYDDLFGDTPQSPSNDADAAPEDSQTSPLPRLGSFNFGQTEPQDGHPQEVLGQYSVPSHAAEHTQPRSLQALDTQSVSKEEQMQQYLISMSRHGAVIQDDHVDVTRDEERTQDLAVLWPKFDRHSVPRFMDLLPLKRSYYVGKKPSRQPRPIYPTKLNLDLASDLEKQFKLPTSSRKTTDADDERQSVVRISFIKPPEAEKADNVAPLSDSDGEFVGGITWQDLRIVCEDWDNQGLSDSTISNRSASFEHQINEGNEREKHSATSDDQWEMPSAKRRRTGQSQRELLLSRQLSFPTLEDPEYTTLRVAQRVTLDLNDPRILVEKTSDLDSSRDIARRPNARTRRPLMQRYNISNDEAYDLLKENHQSKIRSNLGNPQVEHSLPAVRLQWPYYKTKLEKQEARSFHRPVMSFRRDEKILFSRPRHIKKKHLKGKDTFSLYSTTHDLSLSDNASVLLLEYSEEFPTIMSNVGMGSRIINYYRRRSAEDSSRPKLEIGETSLLMPQDKSPFAMFGHIDAGETSPALYNGMYKAPLFGHEPKRHDFIVVRNTTGVHGPSWYIRGIENLRVVGQEFPSIDVPGPHSRKVTTAAKNRLKMISYRLLRKSKTHKIKVSAVTKHFMDSTDMQNRQKMKEFMQFDKTGKEWEMRSGEAIPDEDTIRTMVRPEDVCLLESMQVGQQHLQDAGFGKGDDDAEGEAANQGRGIEQLLAPWFTTRNFLNAVQGKAMLELHGEGDPSGRGEAFSFVKTSMKGGFKAMGESVEDRLDAKKMKELGGHSYNVARQQRSYEESIRRIWDAQRENLSKHEESDAEKDDLGLEGDEDYESGVRTPHSEAPTPASLRRKDDETMSQFSKFSSGSQAGKVLKITRRSRNPDGSIEESYETIRNARVIRQYLKRRNELELNRRATQERINSYSKCKDSQQTTCNARHIDRVPSLLDELARVERNKDRRLAREKQKCLRNGDNADSPSSPSSTVPAPPKVVGTQRKCANCGQVGHIKTNKKLCPMLNGTVKQDDVPGDSPFAMGAPAL